MADINRTFEFEQREVARLDSLTRRREETRNFYPAPRKLELKPGQFPIGDAWFPIDTPLESPEVQAAVEALALSPLRRNMEYDGRAITNVEMYALNHIRATSEIVDVLYHANELERFFEQWEIN